jgi:hypothetical protein
VDERVGAFTPAASADELVDRTVKVWAPHCRAPMLADRIRRGGTTAVVVQRMVVPERCGTLFTPELLRSSDDAVSCCGVAQRDEWALAGDRVCLLQTVPIGSRPARDVTRAPP